MNNEVLYMEVSEGRVAAAMCLIIAQERSCGNPQKTPRIAQRWFLFKR